MAPLRNRRVDIAAFLRPPGGAGFLYVSMLSVALLHLLYRFLLRTDFVIGGIQFFAKYRHIPTSCKPVEHLSNTDTYNFLSKREPGTRGTDTSSSFEIDFNFGQIAFL